MRNNKLTLGLSAGISVVSAILVGPVGADTNDFRIDLSTLGRKEHFIDSIPFPDKIAELPELVVESRKHQALHLLGYVREYSTLTTYTDTVLLFREKTVDFMIPLRSGRNYRGWVSPRLLASRSYYRFTNAAGLDSVSDHFRQHFSWSDWVDIVDGTCQLPAALRGQVEAADTAYGKYSAATIWRRNDDRVYLDLDLLADRANRAWLPDLFDYFGNKVDFTRFTMRYLFDGVDRDAVTADNVAWMSFNIESNGRGRNLREIFHKDDPIYVNTYAEVYITDREYMTIREAHKWEKKPPRGEDIGIRVPREAAPLSPVIASIVERVNAIDPDAIRLDEVPDQRYVGRDLTKKRGLWSKIRSIFG